MYLEFAVRGVTYRTQGIEPANLTHVAREVAPALVGLAPLVRKHLGGEPAKGAMDTEPSIAVLDELVPIIQLIGSVPRETHEFLFGQALGGVERLAQSGRWERIWTARGGLAVKDISAADLVEIVATVLGRELGAFMHDLVARIPPSPVMSKLRRHLDA